MSKIEVNQIDTISGSSTLLVGPSAATKLTFSSTLTVDFNVNSPGVTLNSTMKMTPAFEAKLSSNQSVPDNTNTLVQFDTEEFDTDSDYDTSTYRFTPQSAGKYFVYLSLGFHALADAQLQNIYAFLRKNVTDIKISHNNYAGNNIRFGTVNINAIVDLNGSTDYIEARAFCADSSGNADINGSEYSTFGAYKVIGA